MYRFITSLPTSTTYLLIKQFANDHGISVTKENTHYKFFSDNVNYLTEARDQLLESSPSTIEKYI